MSNKNDELNIEFEKWFSEKDFTILEAMIPEKHKEYYCRTGYFKRQDEIDELKEQLESTKRELNQQRFNNKNNLSIDQKVADEMEKLRKIVNCTYQHEFKLMGNVCLKCGWSQPLKEIK